MKFLSILLITVLTCIQTIFGQVVPHWNNAINYGVLAATSVVGQTTRTNIGTGDIGVYPGTNISITSAGYLDGNKYAGSMVAGPMTSANEIYNSLKNQAGSTTDLSGKILGQTAGATVLDPGIYTFSGNAQLGGTLILDDKGDQNAVFIFRINGTLTTTSGMPEVRLKNFQGYIVGANVFWLVNSTVNINTSAVTGNILANSDITITNSTIKGRVVSLNGSVFLNQATVYRITPVTATDRDGDGAPDASDDFPDNLQWAHNVYSPTTTLVFEDMWPVKGDFDLNDLVITQRYSLLTDANNRVRRVDGSFYLKATGGNFNNGFAVEFPVSPSNTRHVYGGAYNTGSAGFFEPGHTTAVMPIFFNMHADMLTWNTIPGQLFTAEKWYGCGFDVTNGPLVSDFGTDFNPFIFLSGSPRKEVHLPGKTPTQLADLSLFGTGDDGSNTSTGVYYKSKTGLPWALKIPGTFSYPAEGKDISQAYPKFVEWAQSGGISFTDWYSNTAAGYRNSSLIFSR